MKTFSDLIAQKMVQGEMLIFNEKRELIMVCNTVGKETEDYWSESEWREKCGSNTADEYIMLALECDDEISTFHFHFFKAY
jgi:hypothetical protein